IFLFCDEQTSFEHKAESVKQKTQGMRFKAFSLLHFLKIIRVILHKIGYLYPDARYFSILYCEREYGFAKCRVGKSGVKAVTAKRLQFHKHFGMMLKTHLQFGVSALCYR